VYLGRGEVHPAIVTPLVLGTTVGAVAGTRLQSRIQSHQIRIALATITLFVSIQMGLRALGVGLG